MLKIAASPNTVASPAAANYAVDERANIPHRVKLSDAAVIDHRISGNVSKGIDGPPRL
jgi:hypothetical protein